MTTLSEWHPLPRPTPSPLRLLGAGLTNLTDRQGAAGVAKGRPQRRYRCRERMGAGRGPAGK